MNDIKFPTDFQEKGSDEIIKRKYPPLVPKKEMEEKEYNKKLNDIYKKKGSPNRVLNVHLLSIIIGIGILVFIYFVSSGYFKPILVDNSTCTCPEIPACPSYNLTCPATLINATLEIPNTLNLNVVNINLTNSS